MAPVAVLLAVGLLALSGTEARKDKIRVNQWNNHDCHGHVSSPQFEIKKAECKSLLAHSVKIHAPHKKSHFKWFDDINTGKASCTIHYYSDPGCSDEIPTPPPLQNKTATTPPDYNKIWSHNGILPYELEKCVSFPAPLLVRSFRFDCVDTPDNASSSQARTSTVAVWTTDLTGAAFQVPSTTIHTPRSQSTALAARAAGDIKFVWMLNPFSGAETCYKCWKTKGVKFQCEASEGITDRDCGQSPADVYSTTGITTTTSTTVTPVSQITATSVPNAAMAEPEKRGSPKMKVSIKDPFLPFVTCAKAKWKDNGKDNQKVIIKGPRSCPKDGTKAYPIWIDNPVHTTGTATVTYTETALPLITK